MTTRSILAGSFVFLLAGPAAFAGGISFGPPEAVTAAALGAEAVTTADVDGDGDLDVVAASSDDDTVAWHENLDGLGGSWAEHFISTTVDGARAVVAVDLDEDGDQDVASAAGTSGVVAWHENSDGAGGSWIGHSVSIDVPGASAVAAADIDGDGDIDLASASFDGDSIAWHRNANGQGTSWQISVVTTTADGASAVAAADLDEDGDVDLATASANDDTLEWFENFNTEGTAWIERVFSTLADGPSSLVVADVDQDGQLDLLAASELDDTVAWYRNNGTAALFRGEVVIASTVDGARGVAVADFDGDGDTDVLSASAPDNTLAWHENLDGSGGSWAGHPITAAASGVRSVAAADLDGDGDADVLSADFLGDTIAWSQNGGDGPPPPPPVGGPGLDFKPGACPNAFNAKSHGVLTAVIIGSKALDVALVDLDSLRLERDDGVGEAVSPISGPPGPHSKLVDLATADDRAEVCDCTPPGPDGQLDLMLKFDSAELSHEFELKGLPKDTSVRLVLRGELFDGTPFAVQDCLKLVNS